jgi:hypothetical protein
MPPVQILDMETRLHIIYPWNVEQPHLNWNTREHPVYDIPDELLRRWMSVVEQMDRIQQDLSAVCASAGMVTTGASAIKERHGHEPSAS